MHAVYLVLQHQPCAHIATGRYGVSVLVCEAISNKSSVLQTDSDVLSVRNGAANALDNTLDLEAMMRSELLQNDYPGNFENMNELQRAKRLRVTVKSVSQRIVSRWRYSMRMMSAKSLGNVAFLGGAPLEERVNHFRTHIMDLCLDTSRDLVLMDVR